MKHVREEKNRLESILMDIFYENANLSDEEIEKMIENHVLEASSKHYLTLCEKQELKQDLYNTFRKLDILSSLLEDEEITEIMINGYNHIFIEKRGVLHEASEFFRSEERLHNVIQQIVGSCNRIVNETVPIVDARLSDGSRINVVLPPVALDGAVMTIRKFSKDFFTIDKLIALHTITEEAAHFLESLVFAKYNIFVSGGTGAGKTSLLNVLSNFIPANERVITIEDSAELQIQGIPNIVRLETRNANVEGENAITMSVLIKTALRMRPDRIIVGEVRDGAAMDMINSMLTGHDGSLSTGHGNSAKEMLLRLQTMVMMAYEMPVLAIRQQIAAAIDIMVHIGRLRDGSRKILEICEVIGIEDGEIVTHPLFRFRETGETEGKVEGILERIGDLVNKEKLYQSGWKESLA
ncbi:MAG: CpaF family protein [Lachnospiraceae bacterium]|nr:CpaF family protein [Lachnospiraceae bacterium]